MVSGAVVKEGGAYSGRGLRRVELTVGGAVLSSRVYLVTSLLSMTESRDQPL